MSYVVGWHGNDSAADADNAVECDAYCTSGCSTQGGGKCDSACATGYSLNTTDYTCMGLSPSLKYSGYTRRTTMSVLYPSTKRSLCANTH